MLALCERHKIHQVSDLQLLSDDSKVTAAALVWTSTTVHNSCITKDPLVEMTLKIMFAQVSSCKRRYAGLDHLV